ncbi:MAG: FHA domain-containing protein [Polyangiaceae bacterium]
MWKLTIEDDEQKATELPLAHDEYAVGRDETNSIRLTDRNISRRHMVLRRNGDGWLVRDLQSYNGTWVNGNRVAGEQHVGHSDTIQLGDYRLEFTDVARIAPQTATLPGGIPAAVVPPPHQRPDRLVVVVGPSPGQEFPLDRERFTLGRAEEMTISINHSSVSRHHADLIALGGGRYEIMDRQSANGIRINGQEVRRGLLEAGDALELGDVRLRFVGAGKVFRGVLDRQMALPAIVGYDGVSSPKAGAKPSGGVGKVILLGVGIGVIAVVVIFAIMQLRPKPTAPGTENSAKTVDDPGPKILDDAYALANDNQLAAAHQRIKDIPPTSSALSDPRVKEIEGKWANDLFAQFERCDKTDIECRKKLVYEIAASPTVDSETREKALVKLREIDPDAPDPLATTTQPTQATVGGGYIPPLGTTPFGVNPTTSKPTIPPSAKVSADPDALAKATVARLKPQLASKTLSIGDLSDLSKACGQLGMTPCQSECGKQIAELRKKK